MFSIGEFARHRRVSVRMLRHYDAIGLLRPASVEPASGYRFYQASQLAELNRVMALKDLGFTLQQVQAILEEKVSATAAGFEPEAITPVVQPLYDDLWCKLCCAGVPAAGPAIAYYEEVPEGDGALIVHAAVPVRTEADADDRFDVVDLAEVESAATIIHHGSMDDVLSTGQALARWIDANGYRSVGYNREITLEWSPDPEQWVTELQQPIYATGGSPDVSRAADPDAG
jgi:DNA-binding transcriptional MerR regulator